MSEKRIQVLYLDGCPSWKQAVGGQDLWPEDRTDYALDCRVYATPAGLKGWPTVEMLRECLRFLFVTDH